MAVLHARGQMHAGDWMVHESLIGSRFRGRIISETTVAGHAAILPAVEGRAWITGFHEYVVDAGDPWPAGYALNDTWGVTGQLTQ